MEVKVISLIIVDGYNMIGIQHRDLAARRERLVRSLAEYSRVKGHEMTVVFDGWKSGTHREETSLVAGVKVIYSRLGDKADHVIKRIISGSDREWVVISSDREITSCAWTHGHVAVSSEEFSGIMERPVRALTGEFDYIGEEEVPEERTGPRRTLSKKDKMLQRVLKKL